MTADTPDSDSIDTTNTVEEATDDEFTVTPYDVAGEVDYDRLLERFGADPLTDDQSDRFPDHPMVRRRIFYAGRDVDAYLDAAEGSDPTTDGPTEVTHSLVTGRGPSGPMHLGHVLPFYFVKHLQETTGATVYIPLSDDEKYVAKDQSLAEIHDLRTTVDPGVVGAADVARLADLTGDGPLYVRSVDREKPLAPGAVDRRPRRR